MNMQGGSKRFAGLSSLSGVRDKVKGWFKSIIP
jgi:hypothetical protein